jgi:hypothetical protein
MWRVVISSKVPMAVRVRERVAAVPDSFRLTVSETLLRTSEGSSGEPPVPEPLAVSRVPVLAGPEPLSAEFYGLPQPASSRSAARAARSPWVVCLRMVPPSRLGGKISEPWGQSNTLDEKSQPI